jgi:hypothetical protein
VFLGYSTNHKGYKCLEVNFGRVYISRDVVFDETVFPFSKLHPNAGARLRAEISLLQDSLCNPLIGDDNITDQSNGSSPNQLHESSDDCFVQGPEFFSSADHRDFMLPSGFGGVGTSTDPAADLPTTTGGGSASGSAESVSAPAPHASAAPASATTNPGPPPGASPTT